MQRLLWVDPYQLSENMDQQQGQEIGFRPGCILQLHEIRMRDLQGAIPQDGAYWGGLGLDDEDRQARQAIHHAVESGPCR